MKAKLADLQIKTDSVTGEPERIGYLIVQASKGDQTAFGELYEIYADKVYRFVYYKVRDAGTAEDLTSDIFLRAWQKLHQYKPQAGIKFSAWLYTIARNSLVDYYRLSNRAEISFDDLPEIADLEGEEPFKEASSLELALTQLPEEYEQVLRLRFIEELSISKVAQILHKKEANIRAITHRAIKKLKDTLGR